MKVLFVCSGNNLFGISPIVKKQGESLKKEGVQIDYYTIIGTGWSGYIKNIFLLRRYMKTRSYDIIHAHYALSAICASLASLHIPVVASLMGSDLMLGKLWNIVFRFFSKYVWCCTIVKSAVMKGMVANRKVNVIPNGVDLNIFKPLDRESCRLKVAFNGIKNILFVGDINRPEKNYSLAREALEKLNDAAVNFRIVKEVDPEEMVYYYNAADLLILTSRWEGSPNVVKEAMACNLPIVATGVGDIPELIDDVRGCYLTSADPADMAAKIRMALDLHSRTEGRSKIVKMGLDSVLVARKLAALYNDII
jgi:teichuronic acid biosynthesis glycosyltransferase TuaC